MLKRKNILAWVLVGIALIGQSVQADPPIRITYETVLPFCEAFIKRMHNIPQGECIKNAPVFGKGRYLCNPTKLNQGNSTAPYLGRCDPGKSKIDRNEPLYHKCDHIHINMSNQGETCDVDWWNKTILKANCAPYYEGRKPPPGSSACKHPELIVWCDVNPRTGEKICRIEGRGGLSKADPMYSRFCDDFENHFSNVNKGSLIYGQTGDDIICQWNIRNAGAAGRPAGGKLNARGPVVGITPRVPSSNCINGPSLSGPPQIINNCLPKPGVVVGPASGGAPVAQCDLIIDGKVVRRNCTGSGGWDYLDQCQSKGFDPDGVLSKCGLALIGPSMFYSEVCSPVLGESEPISKACNTNLNNLGITGEGSICDLAAQIAEENRRQGRVSIATQICESEGIANLNYRIDEVNSQWEQTFNNIWNLCTADDPMWHPAR